MPDSLKTKADLHLARKVWHLFGVLFIVFLYQRLPRETALLAAVVVSFIFVSLDILRHSFAHLNDVLFSVFRPLMREHERTRPAGTSYLLIGTTLIIFLFSKDVVSLSLLFLAVADPLASFVGLKYGKDKIVGTKSLQGTVAAFFACLVIAASYFFFNNLMTERILIVSLLAGLIGAISELLPIWKLDDNFTFPVLSSSLLWLLFTVFGGA
jgi:diacylglycerol kinase (CTP)